MQTIAPAQLKAPEIKSRVSVQIRLLGHMRISVDGIDVTDRIRPKSRLLLKSMAASRHKGLSREVLCDLLWPDGDPTASLLSLKVEAHNLRRSLGEAPGCGRTVIRNENGAYRLNPDCDIWIDVDSFERLLAEGDELERRGEVSAAWREYENALRLYAGDYLEEDLYEDWTLVARERLKDLHLALLGSLAALTWKAKDYPKAIDYCHQILLADPCREDAYQLLMLAHAAMSQLGRAGAWYAVARRTLQRELDRDVGRRTREVFESLFNSK